MNKIEPKPMSAERRAEIERNKDTWLYPKLDDAIADLLADAAYWRETVRDADGFPGDRCAFCQELDDGNGHKPDCSWLLSQ